MFLVQRQLMRNLYSYRIQLAERQLRLQKLKLITKTMYLELIEKVER